MSEAIIARRQGGKRIPQQIITPSTSNQTITKGLHDGTGYVEGDADLVVAKIKAGVTIFDVLGTYSPITAGAIVVAESLADASDPAQNSAYYKLKDIEVIVGGTYSISYAVRTQNYDIYQQLSYYKVYINNVALTEEYAHQGDTWETLTMDVTVEPGDNIQIWGKGNYWDRARCKDFYVKSNFGATVVK